jgi:Tol biopolymer transport system component
VSGGLSTTLYDVDGHVLDVISSAIGEGEFNHLFVDSFSPDGRWISFRHYSQQPSLPYNTLILANRADQTLIETCLNMNTSVQFSPDGRYVARLNDEDQLQILDIEAWQLYNTGIYHEGALTGWAAY